MAVAYSSYLRIFAPLSAFPEPARRRWEQYVEEREIPTRSEAELIERSSLLGMVAHGPADLTRLPSDEHAFVHWRDGSPLICPWDLSTRALRAVHDSGSVFEFPLDEWYLPTSVTRGAEWALIRRGESAEQANLQIRQQPWYVPAQWFVLFSPVERILDADDYGPRLRYQTSMRQARRRVSSALRVLRGTLDEHPAVEDLVGIGRWLAKFDGNSMIELDYGGLARIIGLETLDLDDSARDLQQLLGFVREGDLDAASEQFELTIDRWGELRQVPRCN